MEIKIYYLKLMNNYNCLFDIWLIYSEVGNKGLVGLFYNNLLE